MCWLFKKKLDRYKQGYVAGRNFTRQHFPKIVLAMREFNETLDESQFDFGWDDGVKDEARRITRKHYAIEYGF
jgi:hypothetical protein